MKHFLLTRFNDYFPSFDGVKTDAPSSQSMVSETDLNPDLGIADEWLKARLRLFFEVTVPTVESQTDKEFTWILKCHPQTPAWAREKLTGNFLCCYDETSHQLSVPAQASIAFTKIIRKITTSQEIITTRLDSDDGLSKDHIKVVKKYIRPRMFFDFGRGIVKNGSGVFLHYKDQTSQFCSYFDVAGELLTVYHKPHINIFVKDRIKNQVDFGWLQSNHDWNITKAYKKIRKYNYQATLSDYETLKEAYPSLSLSWLKHKITTRFL
jgi:Putative rhamnosyl transferase